jgi:phosphatidylserine/phosphatidylglycerophosphate/cardiolipin synthase-like enzyme
MKMSENDLINQIHQEIIHSISDELFIRSEKKNIKNLLKKLAPDKNQCDVLRSEIFDLASEKINGQNYSAMIRWVENLNKVILSTQSSEIINESVYFSPGKECLDAILYQIKNAQQVIQICLFTISDNRISEELRNKHQAGTHVKIITDNDKIFDKGSDIRMLYESGIPVKVDVTDNHMHHKFAIFDKKENHHR